MVLALVAGCTGSSGGSMDAERTGQPGQASATEQAAPATLKVVPAKGAAAVAPGEPVVVTASGGTLTGVTVSGGGFDAGKAWAEATLTSPGGSDTDARWIDIRVMNGT